MERENTMDAHSGKEELVNRINQAIVEIRETVARADPAQLLMMLTDLALMGTPEIEGNVLISHAHEGMDRPTEYVQSIIVSQHSEPRAGHAEEDVTMCGFKVMHDVEELLELIQSYIFLWAGEKAEDNDPELVSLMVEAQFDFMVRGNRYQDLQMEYYKPLLMPHDAELRRLYGVTSAELVEGLARLEHALSQGRFDGMNDLMALMDRHPGTTDPSLLPEYEIDRLRDIVTETFTVDHYDVIRITGWPAELVGKMAYAPGEAHWYDQGKYEYWPVVTLPIHDRPFIELDGRYYCFDYYSLMDNFYRAIQRAILTDDCGYEARWTKAQQEASEALVADIFAKLLPGCVCYRNNYYGPRKSRSENDLLVIYSDVIISVEVKAGQFTAAPPLTDFDTHVRQYKTLIEKSGSQSQRMLDYLRANPCNAPIYDASNGEKARIDNRGATELFAISVTVENVNTFAAKADKLAFLNLPEGVISIAIDDLMTYADYFDSPLEFLHFLKQRKLAAQNRKLALNDELDHLGMYIHHNCYVMEADDIPEDARLVVEGYREELDRYFALRRYDSISIEKPKPEMPQIIADIIELLEKGDSSNKVDASYYVLDLSTEGRDEFASSIEKIRSRQMATHNQVSVSFGGNGSGVIATLFVSEPNVSNPYSLEMMRTQAASLLFALKEPQHALIVLYYDGQMRLTGYHFERLVPDMFDDEETRHLKVEGETLLQFRVDNHTRQFGKIGRNELCPCGSGRKYKKCHGR